VQALVSDATNPKALGLGLKTSVRDQCDAGAESGVREAGLQSQPFRSREKKHATNWLGAATGV
jgi:hypothetical protein